MKYEVMIWKKGEIIGDWCWFATLTEAHYFISRSGCVRYYLINGETGEMLEAGGD